MDGMHGICSNSKQCNTTLQQVMHQHGRVWIFKVRHMTMIVGLRIGRVSSCAALAVSVPEKGSMVQYYVEEVLIMPGRLV